MKKYKNKHEQGHIAIVISEEKYLIIEACTEGGVQYSDNMNFDWFCRLSDIPNKKTNQ